MKRIVNSALCKRFLATALCGMLFAMPFPVKPTTLAAPPEPAHDANPDVFSEDTVPITEVPITEVPITAKESLPERRHGASNRGSLVPPQNLSTAYPSEIDISVSTSGATSGSVAYSLLAENCGTIDKDGVFHPSRAGVFSVRAELPGEDKDNQVFVEYTVEITPKLLSGDDIINTAVSDKTYDGTTAATFAKQPAFAAGAIERSDLGQVTLQPATPYFASKDVADDINVNYGNTVFSLTGEKSGNYKIVWVPEPGKASISKRELRSTALSQTVVYGSPIPLEYEITGFAPGEDEASITGFVAPNVTCSIKNTSAQGKYPGVILSSGGSCGGNYSLTHGMGDLTITSVKPEKGVHYDTTAPDGENGWFVAEDFVITPINDVGETSASTFDMISTDGINWKPELRFAQESKLSKLTFYLRDSLGGALSLVSDPEGYQIDRTPPHDLGISYSDALLERFLGMFSMGFYNPSVVVTFTASDAVSGVEYFDYFYERDQNDVNDHAVCEGGRINATRVNGSDTYVASLALTASEYKQYRGTINFTAVDYGGNASGMYGDGSVLVVDTLAPEVVITYSGPLEAKVTGVRNDTVIEPDTATRFIYSGPVTVRVTVSDANFYPNDNVAGMAYDEADITITATRSLDGLTSDYPLGYKREDWSEEGGVWTLEFSLVGDGDYHVSARMKDRSQNDMSWSAPSEYSGKSGVSEYQSNMVTIDTSVPEIDLVFSPAAGFPNADVFSGGRIATISIADRNFSPGGLAVGARICDILGNQVAGYRTASEEIEALSAWDAWEYVGQNVWMATVGFPVEANYELSLDYVSLAGYRAQTNTPQPFAVDFTAPANLGIEYTSTAPWLTKLADSNTLCYLYFNPDVKITLKAQDMTSGVEYFEWTYTREADVSLGNVEQKTGRVEAVRIGDTDTFASEISLPDAAGDQYRGGISFTAVDRAGHSSAKFDDMENSIVVLDSIAPNVTIAYSGIAPDTAPKNRIKPGAAKETVGYDASDDATRLVYNGPVTAKVVVRDANFYPNGAVGTNGFDADDIKITATRTLDGVTAEYPLAFGKNSWIGEGGDTWSLTFTLGAGQSGIGEGATGVGGDGDYTVSIVYKDRSSNDMSWSSVGERNGKTGTYSYVSNPLTIDTTPPKINVSFDPPTAAAGQFFKAGRTMQIVVTDRNFRPSEMIAHIEATDAEGGNIASFDGFSKAGMLQSWSAWSQMDELGNVWISALPFDEDARYQVSLDYRDLAGNPMQTYFAEPFTIDKTAPNNLSISYSVPLLEQIAQKLTLGYYNPSVTVTLRAEDEVAGLDSFRWTYTREPGADAVNGEIETGEIDLSDNSGKAASASFTLKADELAQYRGSISFTARDRAGNESDAKDDKGNHVVVVDTISPTRTVTFSPPRQIVRASDLKTVDGVHQNGGTKEDAGLVYLYDGSVGVTIHIAEANFYLEDVMVMVNGKPKAVSWTREQGGHTGKFNIAGDGDYVVTMAYTDRSGNKMAGYTSQKITIDTKNPVISVEYSPAVPFGTGIRPVDGRDARFYDTYITARITVLEHNFRADDITAIITAKDAAGQDVAESLARRLTDYLSKRESWVKSGDENTATITYSADANFTFDIAYRDMALRAAPRYPGDAFTVDTIPPEVPTVSYSSSVSEYTIGNAPVSFFSAPVTVTVTTRDDTSGVARIELLDYTVPESDIRYSGGGKVAAASFIVPRSALLGIVQFSGSVDVNAVDRSGNSTAHDEARRLVVDSIAPGVDVTYSKPVQTVDGAAYYDGDIRVSIEINEANFYPEDVKVSVIRDGAPPKEINPDWAARGPDANTGVFALSGDGVYTVIVAYTDRSGNKTADYSSGLLIIDTEKPVLTVSGIADGASYSGGTIRFDITVSDKNPDTALFTPMLSAVVRDEDGAFKTITVPLGEIETVVPGREYRIESPNLERDGVYSLTCTAGDLAGNTSNVFLSPESPLLDRTKIGFSVNRRGSAFDLGEQTAKMVGIFYVQKVYHDIVIIERSVDALDSYSVSLNGNMLAEGADYTVTTDGGDGSWLTYTYRVKKDLCPSEGDYKAVVSSRDKAGNVAFSDMKGAEVQFVVDQTAPTLVVSGLVDQGRYQAQEQLATVMPRDDGGELGSIRVVVSDSGGNGIIDKSGNDISTRLSLDGDELIDALEANDGKLTFSVPSGMNQNVRILCADKAQDQIGDTNFRELSIRDVTVSTSGFILFAANKPLFYGSIAGLCIMVGLPWFFIILRKKRKSKAAI